mgnify:FL=1|jgi:hypothetical protein
MEGIIQTLSPAELGSLDKKEKEPGKSTVLLYGQHRTKEKVAYEVARRVSKFSPLQKKGLVVVEYPKGFDYNDAYEEAKKQTENLSTQYQNIRKVFHEIFREKTQEGHKIRDNVCKQNADKLVLDIHETTDFARSEPKLRRDEIVFLTSLSEKGNDELNKVLTGIFPDLDDIDRPYNKLRLVAKNPTKENTESTLPPNYIAVELITRGDDIYEKSANKDGIWSIGVDEREDYLHREKTDEKTSSAISREATIYTRLLEKIIPEIEKYYTEKVLDTKLL